MRILSYAWHTAHQYEMLKLPNSEWHFLKNRYKKWCDEARPRPKNLKEVTEFRKNYYDFAILWLDVECLNYHPKKQLFDYCKSVIDCPYLIINNTSPIYGGISQKELKKRLWAIVGGDTMVFNSHDSRDDWGGKGEVLIHGIDPNEWQVGKKKKRIVTAMSPYNKHFSRLERYYNRNFFEKAKKELGIIQIGQDVTFNSWGEYKKYLSRSLIYFHPTSQSPMPRSRTEAAMCGCCVVSLPRHEADSFIEVEEKNAIPLMRELLNNPNECIGIGENHRQKAIKLYNIDRYLKDLNNLINKTIKWHKKAKK